MRFTGLSKTTTIVGGLFALLGLGLAAAGIWLVVLGGSPYYPLAGLALIVTGTLVVFRRTEALVVYALFLVATLLWALWEVGFDWWPLAARGGFLFVLAVVLLLPPVTRRLGVQSVRDAVDRRSVHATARHGYGLALTAALGLSLIVAIAAMLSDQHRMGGSFEEASGASPGSLGVPDGEWHSYGRTADGQRYSPLDQITPSNVADLDVAWEFHTGDISRPGDPEETTFQVTPLKIGDRLFLCTPHQSVIALDAVSGQEIWRFDPQIRGELALQHLTCRGLSYQASSVERTATPVEVDTVLASQTPAPVPAAGSQITRGLEGGEPSPTYDGSPDASIDGPADAPSAPVPPASTVTGTSVQPVPDLPVASAQGTPLATCANGRLFMPTADGRVIALDPETGSVCSDFGGGDGQIDLWANMPVVNPGSYYSTSPVVVTANVLIVGGTVLDNVSTNEASGVIRAFDIDTGELVWNWDAGNPEATEPLGPGQTYTPNSPNSWSISSVDEELGLVYVPLGNQPPDQWGGDRSQNTERYSSAVVALDIATGRERWVFQTVHHDLWDYDVPSQPSLVDLTIRGETIPALVQPTKQGELFVLDRRTGEPILPVTETPAPQGAAEGDFTAPTQPVSALSFDPPPLKESDMWGATLFDQLACRIAFHSYRYEGRYTPPSEQGSIIYPGNFGVFNWGSVAIDPVRQMAFTTPTYLAFTSKLVRREDDTSLLVNSSPPPGALPALNENFGAPFAIELAPFLSPLGLPCQQPPWGYVAGADLTTGEIVWMHKNGTVRDASPVPVPLAMGVPNLGGPLVTAGGVAFLSGTIDYYVRGYDVSTGDQLWQHRLPAGGQSTPMTYTGADGRQYLLVVAGGHGSLGTRRGDSVIAYALPSGEAG